MNLKTFRCFITIAEKPTLSAAASALFVSQPALSQHIKKIEDEIGTPLFTRDGHRRELTPAGEVFLHGSRRILQIYESMQKEICMLQPGRLETVRFGISPFYSQYYLPKILPAFLVEHPNIKVDIIEAISNQLEQMLLDGELDFCALPVYPQNDLLEYEPIYNEEILLAVPRKHPLNAHYPPNVQTQGYFPVIDLALLKNEPFIGLKKVQKFSAMGLRLCEEAGFVPHTVCETMNWETVHLLIASGLGVGFVPKILAGKIADPDSCPCYYRLSSNAYRTYAIVRRPMTFLSEPAETLIERIRSEFRLI